MHAGQRDSALLTAQGEKIREHVPAPFINQSMPTFSFAVRALSSACTMLSHNIIKPQAGA
jgi:hypothetical protein